MGFKSIRFTAVAFPACDRRPELVCVVGASSRWRRSLFDGGRDFPVYAGRTRAELVDEKRLAKVDRVAIRERHRTQIFSCAIQTIDAEMAAVASLRRHRVLRGKP